MPNVRVLKPPALGMSFILNVDGQVGPDGANDPGDVRLVQRLTNMAAKIGTKGSRIGLPSVTGQFDAATGFWIYNLQAHMKNSHPNQIVDGIVSPARGSTYTANTSWTIALLNYYANQGSSGEYSALQDEAMAWPTFDSNGTRVT